MSSSRSSSPSSPVRVLPDVARLAALAALWVALWTSFVVAVVHPAARLHAYATSTPASIVTASLDQGGRP